ncbi:30S ribosomal protein S13 [candidate division WWE3 bacterium RIFCSPLOWO2_12_FULL_36_10]|uniref:Small ribosomal subunit protein uS13 n=1 Tax=candidate division WWE3 bacterium RIFCSPLOWO2_12_FULL_36_10 TaxID=1802630 RepID=A0A1F4VHL0_UNCKA|nr:MAG: 30S ribosomal protein S13 [candidate division WWE3 bacterium RIFCSPLOWO2_12_FULL_36_10]
MARLLGVEIPNEKRIEASLVYIYGIGPSLAKRIIIESGVDANLRVKDLTEGDLSKILKAVNDMRFPVEGELRRIVTQNVRRLVDIQSYRGIRHKKGLPVRGQRTRSNARTRKGKRKTVGGLKVKLTKT